MLKSYSSKILEPRGLNISSELKYSDTVVGGTVVNTGSWTKFNLPLQGTTSVTRVADRIRLRAIEQIGVLSTAALDYCRVIIIQTKGLFTTPPATSDLLTYTSPTSPIAYNASNLYHVVIDELHTLVPGSDTQAISHKRDLNPVISEQRFVPGSSNVYDGQLYLLYICITNANVSVDHRFRLWYEDGN